MEDLVIHDINIIIEGIKKVFGLSIKMHLTERQINKLDYLSQTSAAHAVWLGFVFKGPIFA